MNDVPPHMSVLLADISGSARLHEKLGGAEALRAVDRCLKRMERAVEIFGGHIVKAVGDELMATFNHAEEALQAAVEMHQRVADLPPVSGIKLEIRIGFAHGAVGDEEGKPDGDTVRLAASLAGIAKSGQILCSKETISHFPEAQQKAARVLDLPLAEGGPLAGGVAEIMVSSLLIPVTRGLPVSDEVARPSHIRLHYRDKSAILDKNNAILHLGRDEHCDFVIHDRRASRQHAVIEWRGDKPVLIDKSTNGTYVTAGDEPEKFVRRKEFILSGKGMICFSASVSSPDADFICFEVIT